MTDVQNKESKKQLFQIYHPVKSVYERMAIKKEINYSQYSQFEQSEMATLKQ